MQRLYKVNGRLMKKFSLKRAEDYYIKVLLREVKLKEIMTSPVVTAHVDESFRGIPRKFKEHRIRHIPVVGGENKLVGLLSQRDLFRVCPPHKTEDGGWRYDEDALDSVVLKHAMVRNPFYLDEDASMGDALVNIVEHKYGCIPVVNKNMQVQGIVTQHDILAVAAQIFLE